MSRLLVLALLWCAVSFSIGVLWAAVADGHRRGLERVRRDEGLRSIVPDDLEADAARLREAYRRIQDRERGVA